MTTPAPTPVDSSVDFPVGSPAPPARRRRAPLDPRLVREVRAARGHVLRTVLLGLVQAACAITVALGLARLGTALLQAGTLPTALPGTLAAVLLALGVRAIAAGVTERYGHRAATATIADLRLRLVSHTAELGPRAGAGRGADVASLATSGLEKLRPYLVGYVPQLLLAATVTPLCLLVIALLDPLSAVITLVTLPLIPLFMILVGSLTVGRSARLIEDMRSLWAQLLDLVDGLPTLRALGREHGPERTVRALGDRHRASALGSLRYAFLSSMVLEFLATLCVALVAVSIGLRLVAGEMELAPALAVLVLAPEVHLPLRNVGARYHASTDGLAALDATFTVLGEPLPPAGTLPAPDLRRSTLALRDVAVASRHGLAPDGAELTLRPGRVLALTGASGTGKTTAVQVLLGLLDPDRGRAEVIGPDGTVTDVRDLDLRSYWEQLTLLPQRPVLPPGTLREVLTAARPGASPEELEESARLTGLAPVIAARGWDADLGRGGRGLSLGERQRLSLARALLSPAPLVVLDEPTAHLDGGTEQIVLDLVDRLREQGRTVLVVAHRETLLGRADDVVSLGTEVTR
ncbi:thiol reductant ABC exporter subunit CydD [Brachybacterium squillarum]|uniref:thiol reductant ABC exporter subunit CydD n=1 Tax=Brachybacterium squillarum TaxID=661979 RepID=UPI0022213155|nr:thiol reductant ABC exporter subunit CydD [Brachybacterium squillarum]MCW1805328.1 thiol reductant ABC exporter subunit CydD [Brachybacterium squillarum]